MLNRYGSCTDWDLDLDSAMEYLVFLGGRVLNILGVAWLVLLASSPLWKTFPLVLRGIDCTFGCG